MLGQMDSLESAVSDMKQSGAPFTAEIAMRNRDLVNELASEINEECKEIRLRVEAVRAKIAASIGGGLNVEGFLTGAVDDYMMVFDA